MSRSVIYGNTFPVATPAEGGRLMYAGRSESGARVSIDPPVSHRARIEELPEALIHDIWFRREYDHRYLETVDGEAVIVLDTGTPNSDAGPDFLNARIRIDRTEWVGDVEIHRTSSEWLHHRHDSDERYNSVILHVVLAADLWTGGLYRADGTRLTEIALSGFLLRPLRRLLVRLHQGARASLPCEAAWPVIPASVKERLLVEMAGQRLARRAEAVRVELVAAGSLPQVLFERIMGALGYAKNREAMVELARRTPLSCLRSLGTALDIEALLLGSAGLIPDTEGIEGEDADRQYVEALRCRFRGLGDRSDRPPMRPHQWRFFRLRPSNFPPVRIAQAATMVSAGLLAHPDPVEKLVNTVRRERAPLAPLRRCLTVETSSFWQSHVRLERPLRGGFTSLGRDRIDHIILNAILPIVRYVAQEKGDGSVQSSIRTVLRHLPAENDEITRRYAELGVHAASAEITQGLHELHATLCTSNGCLRCGIGRFILSPEPHPTSS